MFEHWKLKETDYFCVKIYMKNTLFLNHLISCLVIYRHRLKTNVHLFKEYIYIGNCNFFAIRSRFNSTVWSSHEIKMHQIWLSLWNIAKIDLYKKFF